MVRQKGRDLQITKTYRERERKRGMDRQKNKQTDKQIK